MAAKEGSMGFYFELYILKFNFINLLNRLFDNGSQTKVTQMFEAENTLPLEMQQSGWQGILNSFKSYAERNNAL